MELSLVYLICFGVGLFFAILSAFFANGGSHPDAHAEGHAELDGGGHEMPGFSPLSPTTIATFVTAFGGFGLILSKIEATATPWLSLSLAALGGFLVAALVFFIFSRIFRVTQSSSEGRVAELFGQSATVITPIAPGGVGEIAYVQGGTRYTAAARADDSRELPSGSRVRIVRASGSQFHVTAE